MIKASRSAKTFIVEGKALRHTEVKQVATFHREYLVEQGIKDDSQMGEYLDRTLIGLNMDQDTEHKYFWAYGFWNNPPGVEVFRFTPSELEKKS